MNLFIPLYGTKLTYNPWVITFLFLWRYWWSIYVTLVSCRITKNNYIITNINYSINICYLLFCLPVYIDSMKTSLFTTNDSGSYFNLNNLSRKSHIPSYFSGFLLYLGSSIGRVYPSYLNTNFTVTYRGPFSNRKLYLQWYNWREFIKFLLWTEDRRISMY